jgi:tripartite-type tricarboxylate transporter receptor subunit TctC
MSKAFQISVVLALFVLAGLANAFGDEFPSRPITLVSPYAAGGGNDFMARTVARGLADVLKQTVVVENKAGASGTIGLTFVSRARPDGYTIVMGGIGSVVLRPAFEAERLKFNPQKELAPVALVAKESPVLMVNSSLNVKTLPGLIALAKTSRITYGTPGVGTAMHLTGELMKQVTGAPMVHIPYRGQGAAFADLLGGTISVVFTDVSVALPYAKDSRVRILAVAGKERSPRLPDVPTTAELGYPKLVMENWYAVYAPPSTPAPIIARLSEAIKNAMAMSEVKDVIGKTSGLIPLAEGPDALKKQTAEDNEKWQPIAAQARRE